MFRTKYTKWKPLGNYKHGGTDYISFVRKNLTNGMMEFKTKIVNPSFFNNDFLPHGLIDTKKAWEEICAE